VGHLISSPSDYPRAYICDECVAVCNSILSDEVEGDGSQAAALDANGNLYLQHPHAPELFAALSSWVARKAEGLDASKELAEVRRLATLIFGQEPGSA
jgi:ATP-dependent protease Clp ATPase subunit